MIIRVKPFISSSDFLFTLKYCRRVFTLIPNIVSVAQDPTDFTQINPSRVAILGAKVGLYNQCIALLINQFY